MEADNWVLSSDDENGSEGCVEDPNDDELCYATGDMPKLQSRYVVSKAWWDDELGMAEVVEKKGKMWVSTGITRNGKLFCTIEETLYLVEIGALQVLDRDETPFSLTDIYKQVSLAKHGYSWDSYEVYKHLKCLGYIVGRHGIPWTMKGVTIDSPTVQGTLLMKSTVNQEPDSVLITNMFSNMQIRGTRPIFDVYSPNSKFRKSAPGNPYFLLCLCGDYPPSIKEINDLESYCGGPFKFCKVEHGRVCFFSWKQVELPVLP